MIFFNEFDTVYGSKVYLDTRKFWCTSIAPIRFVTGGEVYLKYKTNIRSNCQIKKETQDVGIKKEEIEIILKNLTNLLGRSSTNLSDSVEGQALELYAKGFKDISKGIYEKKRFKKANTTSTHSSSGIDIDYAFASIRCSANSLIQENKRISLNSISR